jgi:hemolysin III
MFSDDRLFPGFPLYCEGRHKPYYRGVLHFVALIVFIPIFMNFVIDHVDQWLECIGLFIYCLGTTISWGCSSLLHCVRWPLQNEISVQKLDHSAVFVYISFTYLPVMIILSDRVHHILVYISTLAMILICIYGIYHVYNYKSQRMHLWLVAATSSAPSYPILSTHLTNFEKIISILGLMTYLAGAFIFGKRLLNFFPNTFGYHEVFHLFTIIASSCGFILLWSMCQITESRCLISVSTVGTLIFNDFCATM